MRFRLLGRVYTIPKIVCVGLVVMVLVSVAAVGRYWMLSSKKRADSLLPIHSPSPMSASIQTRHSEHTQTPTPAPSLAIYLTGEVECPGVYWVESGVILSQVVALAGGLTPLAWEREINLALRVEDGMHVHIPQKGEVGGVLSSGNSSEATTPGKVNINTADVETLKTLPGIGESTALDIIQYRTNQGGFKNIEDIMQVPGIKQARFDKIKEWITV